MSSAPAAPRNLIVLSDGTGNSSAKLFRTNVWRVYEALDLNCADQIALYDNGVGTASFKPIAFIGGAFGYGLKRNVLQLYKFLCRNYQPGDRIFAFGFSRGAFTARVVAALVAHQGLIQGVKDDDDLMRLAAWAYRRYRADRYRHTLGVRLLRHLRNVLLRTVEVARRQPVYDQARNREVDIAFLGVWDTVAAYGLPIDELTRGWDKWIWPMLPRDRQLSTRVTRACHAVAIDDERQTFFPLLWDESEEPANATSTHTDQERLSQVWFAGVHSNVGGGYADDGLSLQPLCWIAREATQLGLRFQKSLRTDPTESIPTSWIERAAPCAPMNDSRRGGGAMYRYHPRPIERLCHAPDGTVRIARAKIHRSVFERVRDGRDGYAPIGLPEHYGVVDGSGAILQGDADATPVPAAPNPFEHSTQAAGRVRRQQGPWDVVWQRRVVYFLTVGVAVAMLLKPALPWFNDAAPIADRYAPLKAVVDLTGAFLPAMADGWLDHYRKHPTHLVVGAAILAVLLWWSGRLRARITGRMGQIWRHQGMVATPVDPAPAPRGWIFRLRTAPAYMETVRFMSTHVWPTVFGVAMLLTLFVVVPVRASFEWASRSGSLCGGGAVAASSGPAEFALDPRAICQATGVEMEQDHQYLIQVALPVACPAAAGDPTRGQWQDGQHLVPSPAGFTTAQGAIFAFAWPFRRVLNQDWFVPIAAIGTALAERHPLGASDGRNTILAGRPGPLTLWVNDAVVPLTVGAGTGSVLCVGWDCLYRNNRGGPARVRVTKLEQGVAAVLPDLTPYTCDEQARYGR